MKFLAFVLLPMLFCFYKLYLPIVNYYRSCHRINKLQHRLDQLRAELAYLGADLEEVKIYDPNSPEHERDIIEN